MQPSSVPSAAGTRTLSERQQAAASSVACADNVQSGLSQLQPSAKVTQLDTEDVDTDIGLEQAWVEGALNADSADEQTPESSGLVDCG